MNGSAISSICEACERLPMEVEVPVQGESRPPYYLCRACAERLQNYALRPLEWYHLSLIHGADEFYLHDDFYYDEDGTATQPKEAVENPEKYPSPKLAQVTNDLEKLFDFTVVHWPLALTFRPELLSAFALHEQQTVLECLKRRAAERPNSDAERTAFHIAGRVLHEYAAKWIRESAHTHSPSATYDWAAACARCLPIEEGFPLVVSRRTELAAYDSTILPLVLGDFRSPLGLDWIEANIHEPLTDSWGRLAALSAFSWSRAKDWLRRGRPLSLVALDALNFCWRYDTLQLREARPKLFEPAARSEMIAELHNYTVRDDWPRPENAARRAIEHLDEILGIDSR